MTASGPSCSTQDLLASCGIFRWRHTASLAVMHRLRHSEACGILVPLPGCRGSNLCPLHLHVDSQPLEVSPGKSPKKHLKFSHLSDVIRLVRGTELQSAASRLSIWLTHRLTSGPDPWDLLYEGLRLPEYLPGVLPVVTGALDPLTRLPGGAVDPLGWDWGWVPRDLPLKCRSSLRGYYGKQTNKQTNTEVWILRRSWLRKLCVLWVLDDQIIVRFGLFGLSSFIFTFRKFSVQVKKKITSWIGLAPLPGGSAFKM